MWSLKAMDLVPMEDRSCSFGSYILVLTEQHTPECVSSLMNKAKQFLLPQDPGKHLSNIYYFLKSKRGLEYIGSK